MDKQRELKERLYNFALEIVKLVRALPKEIAGVEIGKQLLKAGTSIAANYEEATSGFSRADFVYKLSISFKESKETHLWLRLLEDSGIVHDSTGLVSLIGEAGEISNILAKSLKTSRSKIETG